MTTLITGADSLLGRALIAALGPTNVHALNTAESDLRDPAYAESLVKNVDAVVHLAPLYARLATHLEDFDNCARGTFTLTDRAAKAGVKKMVLASSLALFRPEDAVQYRVNETFRPQPTTNPDHLCAWLAEITARETVRSHFGVNPLSVSCLRLGTVVDDAAIATAAEPDAAWLHVDDAVRAIQRALEVESKGWQVLHISAGPDALVVPGRAKAEPFSFEAQQKLPKVDLAASHYARPRVFEQLSPPKSIKNVVLLGAGGPLGTAITEELSRDYTLRLCDIAPVEKLLETLKPQGPGAPLPVPPKPPHEWRTVDVRDPQQVLEACRGMDAIINVTVIRHDVGGCFQVNMNGAHNVMSAALALKLQRVVHTGPYQVVARGATGYEWDYELNEDMPPRPGIEWPYLMSKHCGQEVVKIFARQHGFSVPALNFLQFVNHEVTFGENTSPMSVSWADAARAIRCALEAPHLPSPFELFHIGTDLPHDNYPNTKAKRLLGWQPQHRLESFYRR